MSAKEALNAAVSKWNLLRHPFYQAWSAGTLPIESLRTYAREYGAFVRLLPQAWDALADPETSQEEREHADLWDDFAAALETRVDGQALAVETQALTASAARLFSEAVTAAGALYAFEVQQPATAQSKLVGLRMHYRLPTAAEPYFEVHSRNVHEAAKLLARIDSFSPEDQTRTVQACSEMAERLWNALSGIYGEDRMGSC
jgi:pyrroloquinoline-quinone synthase